MSIFKRLYGRPMPTKMESEAAAPAAAETPVVVVVPTTEVATPAVTTATETTPTATATATAPTTTTPTTNGGPRFHFGAKAKLFRDMIAQHKWSTPSASNCKFDSDQTRFIGYQCLIALVCMCFVIGVSTAHWECEGSQCYGFWNTCQKQTTLSPPDNTTGGMMDNSTMPTMTTIWCLYYKYQNTFQMVVAEQLRIDQVTIAQVLVVAGTIMCVMSLITLVMAYHFIKTKRLNCMRNTLVCCIFMVVVTYLLHLIGMYFYLMTERFSSSVTCLFVYFGFAFLITNVINLFTIEYKAYKMRQQVQMLQQ